jgi:hypothetical protein
MEPPRHPALHDTVSALVYSLASAQGDSSRPELRPPFNDLTQFVLRRHDRMTDYLRAPLAGLTFAFDSLGVARSGRFFRHQPSALRQKQIEAWKKSPASFKRDLIRFYESLTALALHTRATGSDDDAESLPLHEPGDPLGPSLSSSGEDVRNVGKGVIHTPPHELRCEIAVIGSGPGGSITACLLAEAGRDVLLIEEGPCLPLESCIPFSRQEMEQKYRNGGLTVALGKSKIAYVEGRCVGGGSEINSGLYHRTPPDILEEWRKEFQVEALTEADLIPYFEACERELSVSPQAANGNP